MIFQEDIMEQKQDSEIVTYFIHPSNQQPKVVVTTVHREHELARLKATFAENKTCNKIIALGKLIASNVVLNSYIIDMTFSLTGKKNEVVRFAQKLEQLKLIECYYPDFEILNVDNNKLDETRIINIPNFPRAWSLSPNHKIIGIHKIKEAGLTGDFVTVGIADTGIDESHEQLKPNYAGYWIDGFDRRFISGNEDVSTDKNGHGTYVTGIICGRYTIGIAPDTKWVSLKILDEEGRGWFRYFKNAIEVMLTTSDIKIADIIHCSFRPKDPLEPKICPLVEGVIESLNNLGIYVCFAGGQNRTLDTNTVNFPGNLQKCLAIGAVDIKYDDKNELYPKFAPFDETGTIIPKDIDLSSWMPISNHMTNIVMPGVDIVTCVLNNKYAYLSGTSLSSAHMTGCICILYQYFLSRRVLHLGLANEVNNQLKIKNYFRELGNNFVMFQLDAIISQMRGSINKEPAPKNVANAETIGKLKKYGKGQMKLYRMPFRQ
jgi:major intracellular serine protease